MPDQVKQAVFWRSSVKQWGLLALPALIMGFVFSDGLAFMVNVWLTAEEYSHGILIPFIALFLIWQKRNELAGQTFAGSWAGIGLVAAGLFIYFLGELSTLYTIIHYAFLIVLMGGVLAIGGREIFKRTWMPLFFLFFAIPLPSFLFNNLSSTLQLWSSQLGVSFIRFCDISVYLEGNVIDLGTMQLQVVEACSGLRYLFSLMTLAFMCAYIYNAALWKRAVIFLSSMPIAIFMNSFRIGVIGVTVEYFGKKAAEGFLHDFEGWIVFMACTGILIAEMWILARIGKDPRPLADVFGLTLPAPLPANTVFRERELPGQFWAVGALLLAALGLSLSLEQREEIVPARAGFADFPLRIADWTGRRQIMEQQYVDALDFDDYILADYMYRPHPTPLPEGEGAKGSVLPADAKGAEALVNFYAAYYANQRKGESIHSPRSCIPGGGWQIASHDVVSMDGLSLHGRPLKLNRLLIKKGENRQLVYYWFQQRGRNLTNEYLVKWFLFQDALVMNRTDGALVRLTTPSPRGEDLAAADLRLRDFLQALLPALDRHIPDSD